MDDEVRYEAYLRERITQLREQRGISEHRMSLELGKSGSYIRSITNGITLPSVKELFNIILYFEITPAEFFAGLDGDGSLRYTLTEKLRGLPEEDLKKVAQFIEWMAR